MLVDIIGIALFASLAFTIYYLRKIIKLLKGGKGWKLITIGIYSLCAESGPKFYRLSAVSD